MREVIPIHLTQFDRIIPPVMNHFHGGISITLLFYVLFAKLDHHDRFYNDVLRRNLNKHRLIQITAENCAWTRVTCTSRSRERRISNILLYYLTILPNFCVIIVKIQVPYTTVNPQLFQLPLHHATHQKSLIPT